MKKNQTQILDKTDCEVLQSALELYAAQKRDELSRWRPNKSYRLYHDLIIRVVRARFLLKSLRSWDADIISATAWTPKLPR